MKNVLIIEDDKEISDLLGIHLKDIQCIVNQEYNGIKGLNAAKTVSYDLIILDIMLPGMDGFDVCRELRKAEIKTPVLMLTSKSDEVDKVIGLELGADDYLTKPFGIREFIARVKAIFRRVESFKPDTANEKDLQFRDLVIESSAHRVLINNKRIDLTPKEFDLLYLMASNPGHVYSREDLLNIIWGYEHMGYEHTVNSHINRLRKKIETDASNPRFILTSWGSGYMFNDQII
ncbi:MAG: response regulator transcription factor [Ignavibacteriaceae bacterium]|nr:response regulator transcription factor [Ignavibacteriaceae bacterium]